MSANGNHRTSKARTTESKLVPRKRAKSRRRSAGGEKPTLKIKKNANVEDKERAKVRARATEVARAAESSLENHGGAVEMPQMGAFNVGSLVSQLQELHLAVAKEASTEDIRLHAETNESPAVEEVEFSQTLDEPKKIPVVRVEIETSEDLSSDEVVTSEDAAEPTPQQPTCAPTHPDIEEGNDVEDDLGDKAPGEETSIPVAPMEIASDVTEDPSDTEGEFEVDGTNFYLAELGVPKKDQVCTFASDKDERSATWSMQRKVFGQDETELWSLDTTFLQWMYCHVRMFKDIGGCEGHMETIPWDGVDLMLPQALDILIDITGRAILHQYGTQEEREEYKEELQQLTKLWGRVLPSLWF